MNLRRKDAIAIALLCIATLAAFCLISADTNAHTLSIVHYEVETPLDEPIRIVQLSDLHSHIYGKENDALVELVAAQQPDLIAMTGDMLDKQDADPQVACDLIRNLKDIAPVYYCFGNHEMDWEKRTGRDLNPSISEAGAIVLDTDYLDVEINGQPLRIGGFHGYYRYWGMLTKSKDQWNAEQAFSEAFEETEQYKVLLCHIPTGWIDWGNLDKFPVDLVLTGHYHGGQVRLPLIGGLYAPYVGLFPEYTEGMFTGEMSTCILSTGLGSSPGIPRINNPPQVVVVDLIPKN